MFLLSLFKRWSLSKRQLFKLFIICIVLLAICCIPLIRSAKNWFVSCVFFVNVKLNGSIHKLLCLLRLSKLKEISIPVFSSEEFLLKPFRFNTDWLTNEVLNWLAVKEIAAIIEIWRELNQTFTFCYQMVDFCFRKNKATKTKNALSKIVQSRMDWHQNYFIQIAQNIKIHWNFFRSNFLNTFWFDNIISNHNDETKQIQRHFCYGQNNISIIDKTFNDFKQFYSNFLKIAYSLKKISLKMTYWIWKIYKTGNRFIENTQMLSIPIYKPKKLMEH